jgi:hypothetical protein
LLSNAFDTHAGKFLTSFDARSLVEVDGSTIPGVARPVPPRRIDISYAFALGRNAHAPDTLASSFSVPSQASDVLVPGTLIERWPMTAPRNPFERNTGTRCLPEHARLTDDVLSKLQRYSRTLGEYAAHSDPSLPLPEPPVISGLTVTPIIQGKTYVVEIQTSRYSLGQGIFTCAAVHVGTPANADSAHLPTPPPFSTSEITFFFTPSKGLYFIQMPAPPDITQRFRTYEFPKTPPTEPFALTSTDLCTGDSRTLATKLLGELSTYFRTKSPPSGTTDDWTIVDHHDTNSWWELRSDDLRSLVTLINCAHVVSASKDDLHAAGVGAAKQPAFGYAPAIGLYVAKP